MLDHSLLLWINQGWASPFLDGFFSWVSARATFAFPITALLAWISWKRFGKAGLWLWFAMVLSVVLADRIGDILKVFGGVPRPCFDMAGQLRVAGGSLLQACGPVGKGMPSNHSLNYFTAAAFLAVFYRRPSWRVVLFGVALTVAISRLYLAKHYPSQVTVGALLGLNIGFFCAWVAVKVSSTLRGVLREAQVNSEGQAVNSEQ